MSKILQVTTQDHDGNVYTLRTGLRPNKTRWITLKNKHGIDLSLSNIHFRGPSMGTASRVAEVRELVAKSKSAAKLATHLSALGYTWKAS
jgi:hypothetical protein